MVSTAFNKGSQQAPRLPTLHRSIMHWLMMEGRVWLIPTTTQVMSPLHHQNFESLSHHHRPQCQITMTHPMMMDMTLMVYFLFMMTLQIWGRTGIATKKMPIYLFFPPKDPEKCSTLTINTVKNTTSTKSSMS